MTAIETGPAGMPVIDHGVHEGIAWAVARAPLYGALNGYVRIPDDHPWFGLDHDAPGLADVEVHGGLTYGRGGWIGFDTLHLGDAWPGSPDDGQPWARRWTDAEVVSETKRLAEQVKAASR